MTMTLEMLNGGGGPIIRLRRMGEYNVSVGDGQFGLALFPTLMRFPPHLDSKLTLQLIYYTSLVVVIARPVIRQRGKPKS